VTEGLRVTDLGDGLRVGEDLQGLPQGLVVLGGEDDGDGDSTGERRAA
jgi:hypothetical protein